MSHHILFVDDDPNLLSGFERMFRQDFDVTVATSAEAALGLVEAHKPISVVVCDLKMPGIDGIETLKRFSAKAPDAVRIMLTGDANQDSAVRAINEGRIFRYVSKPCSEVALRSIIQAALRQYELVVAERTILEKTLLGCVRTLTDVLTLVQPEAYGRAARIRQWVKPMIKLLNQRNIGDEALASQRSVWEIQLAALLWPIGLISVPPHILTRAESEPSSLSNVEKDILAQAPETSHRLLANIPRLENVAEIVRHIDRGYDGSGGPVEGPKGTAIPEGARILKLLKDLAIVSTGDTPTAGAVAGARSLADRYDPAVLATAEILWGRAEQQELAPQRMKFSLSINSVIEGDYLVADIVGDSGKLLLSAGQKINKAQIEKLRNLQRLQKIHEPIVVEREL